MTSGQTSLRIFGLQRARGRRIATLRNRVTRRRNRIEARQNAWVFPLFGMAAGLLVPVVSRSDSRNPVVNLAALARRAIGRTIRLTLVTAMLQLFKSTGTPARERVEH